MKKNKIYKIIVLIIIFTICIFLVNIFPKEIMNLKYSYKINDTQGINKQVIIEPINKYKQKTTVKTETKNIKVLIFVLDKKYDIEVKDGSTIVNMMDKMQAESGNDNIFTYEYKEHLGLGRFITEINGKRGTDGKYWIYYVNNQKASIGASNYKLKEGDSINWKLE